MAIVVFPSHERSAAARAFTRGIFAFIPLAMVEAIASTALDPGYGTPNFIAYEWVRLILPCALVPLACFGIFYRLASEPAGEETNRRILSFYAGALSPVALVESIRIWERPEPYSLFILPFALATIALAAPVAIRRIRESRPAGVVVTVLVAVTGSLILSLGHWLFTAQLWPLAALATMAAFLAAWIISVPALRN
ncbi:MAG: hypothetical protein Q8M76_12800 [Spirochaetaceae bacterium]|nr:hypothetical protein [Spirochaetaceae bacterium]